MYATRMGKAWDSSAIRWCSTKVAVTVHLRFDFGLVVDFFLSAFHLLRYPTVTTERLKAIIPELADIDPKLSARLDIEGKGICSSAS